MTPKKEGDVINISQSLQERLEVLERLWLPLEVPGKVIVIRPRVPGDDYTEIGSNNWAGDVKQKALAEAWQVTDLSANDATRENIETHIGNVSPHLVIHYDHGSPLTLWGQEDDDLEAGIDENNINLVAGRILSTVSCYSASGLGPVAIAAGVTSYLGYTEPHGFWTGYEDAFGSASNMANYALLECKTTQEAFDLGWAAYDQLYDQLLAEGGFAADFVAPTALHDRDCFTLLGSATAVACPRNLLCIPGGPDMVVHCLVGPDAAHCLPGNPDMMIHCKMGLPDSELPICGALPENVVCRKGPDMCLAGPPLRIREVIEDYPIDLLMVDLDKIPRNMRKAMMNMLDEIKRER
ncbi:MAG: hypothetical protein JXB35_14295 [Anaerolineae bacterium]|nr:hypothetical protein [Anaerolineae bacterium]